MILMWEAKGGRCSDFCWHSNHIGGCLFTPKIINVQTATQKSLMGQLGFGTCSFAAKTLNLL